MIQFLNLSNFIKGLKPVTSAEFLTRTGGFNTAGLFSEDIFGPLEMKERKTTFSYINLYSQVIHPTALTVLLQLDRRIELFISAQESFSLDNNNRLQIDENGVTGISEFIKIFSNIEFREDTETRKKLSLKIKESYDKKSLFIDVVPVIPPDQRPMYRDESNQWIIDDLNNYYIKILRRANLVRTSAKSGPLFDLLNYELQKAVIDHDNYIRTKIQKKKGIIRSELLGKRTDFSGRAVITPGPDLKVNEIGLPLRLAVPLFEPFIIHRLLYSGRVDKELLNKEVKSFTGFDLSIDSIRKVFKSLKSGDEVPKSLYDIIFEAVEVSMIDRYVLAKRDPALHAESVRGFKPILIDGNTIKLCTLQTGGFNADFDGDSMAVFHPLTRESQDDIKEKMMRAVSGENSYAVTFGLSKEMCTGLFILTKNIIRSKSPISVNNDDLEKATDPYIPVKYRGKNTTMGKAIFNSCFPTDFPFFEKQVNKGIVNDLINVVLDKYGQDVTIEIFSKLEKIGFKFATIMAPTFTLDNLEIPDEIYVLKEKLAGSTTEEASVLLEKMKSILIDHLKNTGLYDLVESGASKGWDQPMQILVAKGIIADLEGNILPVIKGSFTDGLSNVEYFDASAGSRKGIIDRVINTSDTGYLSRRLAFLLNSVEIDRQLKDCGTNRTLTLRLTKDLIRRLKGRYVIVGDRLEEFSSEKFKVGDSINLRTSIYCKSPKLCHVCYGKLLERHKSPYAGIIAAQVIGERSTQLIMKSFHTGGAISIKKYDIMKDILDNDPLIKESNLSNCLTQSENYLVANKSCTIKINMDDYGKDDIIISEEKIWLKSLISIVEFEDVIFNLILDYPVELQVIGKNTEIIDKKSIQIDYEKNATILEVLQESQEIKQQTSYVDRILGGREIYKDVDHLFKKLFAVYMPMSNMDLTHLEVLVSQCLRDKSHPELAARLGSKWDPVMMNIKKIVFSTSFVQGLAFENIGEAIRTGLISEEPLDSSILEKVLTGTLTEK